MERCVNLDFAGGIGERAVFFVSGGGGQDDVGALRGFGEEHVVNDEQFETGEAVGRGDGRKFLTDWRRQRRELSVPGDGGFHHCARGEAGVGKRFDAPDLCRSGRARRRRKEARSRAGDRAARPYRPRRANSE